MALSLEQVSIEEVPRQERTSKWRELLQAAKDSGNTVARVKLDGEKGRDGEDIGPASAASGLGTARKNAQPAFDMLQIRQRGNGVYIVNLELEKAEKEAAEAEAAEQE